MRIASAFVLTLLLTFPTFAATPLTARQTLKIGVAEGKGKQTAADSFAPFLKQMNLSPRYAFEMVVFEDGEKQYEALRDHKVDLAFLGPAPYVKAHFEFKAEPVVAEAGELRSMLVVAKSSPIRSVDELRGKTLALGYEGSTTTHLLPMLLLSKHQLKSENLGRITFVGDQTRKIVDAILDGSVVAGGISETLYDANKDKLRILETSEALPGALMVAHPKVGANVLKDLRSLFIQYVPAASSPRFTKGAVAVTNDTYNRVRFLCKVVLGRMYL
ncbi:MAG: PhnD/SsuA/transferrin family substrate-binding protein [Acidobacteriota bacterium]